MRSFTDPLPLRTTAAWSRFRDVQPIPHRYGRTTGLLLQYDAQRRLFVWADHPCASMIAVTSDGQAINDWRSYAAADSAAVPVQFIEFGQPQDEGAVLAATGIGKMHARNGRPILNPADVLWDMLANIAGMDVEESDLDTFRSQCSGFVAAGSLTTLDSIHSHAQAIARSFGAVFGSRMPGYGCVFPVPIVPAPVAVAVTLDSVSLSSAAILRVKASAAITIANVTGSATANLPIKAAAALSVASVASVSASMLAIHAEVPLLLADVSATIEGATSRAGALSGTVDAVTISTAAALALKGQLSITTDAFTSVSAATSYPDPNFASVVLLLHFDGTDGSPTFTDVTGKTMTPAGNAQIDTAQSKFGGASGLFDGTGDYLTTPDHTGFNLGTGDFTVEFWAKQNTTATTMRMVSTVSTPDAGVNYYGFGCYLASTFLAFNAYNGAVVTRSASRTVDTAWHHYAFVQSGSSFYMFQEGTLLGTTASVSCGDSTSVLNIGQDWNGGSQFDGWIDDLRITNGVGRYTSAFTPPTMAFPDHS